MTVAAIIGAVAVSADNSTVECAKGLKIFVSRGTGEEMGPGATKVLVDQIADQIDGSDIEPILYPASWDNPVYASSVTNGTKLIRKTITEYAKGCPDSKMAWFGYSQGAQITSNNFCGMPVVWGVETEGNVTYDAATLKELVVLSQPLPKEVTKNVISVVLFGDPSQRNDTSYNYGTWNNSGNGMFYRHDTSACEALGSRIRAYCDAGDPFCDVGSFVNATAHGRYIQHYGKEVIQYVVGQYKNGTTSGTATSAAISGTSSPTSSPSPSPAFNGAMGSRPMSVFPLVGLVLVCLFL